MTDESKIRAAWARYHGGIPELDGYVPATPPTYSRGYRDGYAAGMQDLMESVSADAAEATAEVRAILEQLDRIDAVWGDGPSLQDCRDRLRALVMP